MTHDDVMKMLKGIDDRRALLQAEKNQRAADREDEKHRREKNAKKRARVCENTIMERRCHIVPW